MPRKTNSAMKLSRWFRAFRQNSRQIARFLLATAVNNAKRFSSSGRPFIFLPPCCHFLENHSLLFPNGHLIGTRLPNFFPPSEFTSDYSRSIREYRYSVLNGISVIRAISILDSSGAYGSREIALWK